MRRGAVIALGVWSLASSAVALACEVAPLPDRPDISAEARARRELYLPLVLKAACDHGVSAQLLDALVIQESRYNPTAVSPAGAIGLGQLMPGTARLLGVNPWSPEDNLAGAARYLRQQLDEFGSVSLALAAYNAGPGRVRRSGAVPRIRETVNYVATIERDLARWGRGGLPPSQASSPSRSFLMSNADLSFGAVDETLPTTANEVAAAPPPAHWDVFARFRWEREQQSKPERSDDE